LSRAGLSSERKDSAELLQIETSRVFVGKLNVRKRPGDVIDLTRSIQEKGVLEPVLVRPVGYRYELVIGSRRLEAAKAAGLKKLPAVVRKMSDEEAIIVSLIENIQRRDLEPEEEYDGLMMLRRLNPKFYGTSEQLAKAIGKSRRYVEDHINAVETVRGLRRETRAEVTVKSAPTSEERKEGVLPLKHATYIHKAEETPSIQGLPSRERAVKLKELAETIAPLPQPEAEKVVSHFVMAPQKSMEEIRKDVQYLRAVKLEILLDPRVAEALRTAAEDRRTTMEAVASLAIHSWLRQQSYF
jgi:ParB/RepB/Spo0J family partition protein